MELRQLRYFVAIAEAGSISRAAARCRVAQPSLSQQIAKLEDELGVTLLDRLGRGVALTDAGRALLSRARRVLAEVHAAETTLRTGDADETSRLVIGAIPTMAPFLLPPLLAKLRTAEPMSELTVHEDLTQNLVEAIGDNTIDLAITSTPIDNKLVDVEVIGREPLLVAAPARAGLGDDEGTIALPELRDSPAVTLHGMHCLGQQVEAFCAARRLATDVVCRTTQVETLLEFVRLGLGVAVVPQMIARHDTNRGRAYLRFKRNAPTREIALVWRRGRTRPRLARLAADHLRRIVSSD